METWWWSLMTLTLTFTQATSPLSPIRSRAVDLKAYMELDTVAPAVTKNEGQEAQHTYDPGQLYKVPDERKHRQLTSNLVNAASTDYTDTDFGNYASAGHYGHGHHDHGWGWGHKDHKGHHDHGWGWGQKDYKGHHDKGYHDKGYHDKGYHDKGHHAHGWGWGWGGHHGWKKQDCHAALGLLGTLGLITFLTTVLRALGIPFVGAAAAAAQAGTGATGAGGTVLTRTKREADADGELNDLSYKITRLMLPLMIRVGQARDGYIPTKCTLHEICRSNKILVTEVGADGRYLGSMMTEAISKMLLQVSSKFSTIDSDVGNAGRSGRSDLNCDLLYPECQNLPPADIPQFVSILESPLGKAYTTKYSTST